MPLSRLDLILIGIEKGSDRAGESELLRRTRVEPTTNITNIQSYRLQGNLFIL